MKRLVYLSYPLRSVNPAYGQEQCAMEISPVKSMAAGDSCNVFRIGLENHWGTHVDGPRHFFNEGPEIAAYAADFWFFSSPQLIHVDVSPGQIIGCREIAPLLCAQADLLLICSGWGRFRHEPLYSRQNPGLDPELGRLIRRDYPGIRAIGLDFISVSSYMHRDLGRESHRAFLAPVGGNAPLVIIEDMDLSADLSGLSAVWIAPLRVEGIDSAPCTAVGICE